MKLSCICQLSKVLSAWQRNFPNLLWYDSSWKIAFQAGLHPIDGKIYIFYHPTNISTILLLLPLCSWHFLLHFITGWCRWPLPYTMTHHTGMKSNHEHTGCAACLWVIAWLYASCSCMKWPCIRPLSVISDTASQMWMIRRRGHAWGGVGTWEACDISNATTL